MKKKYTFIYSVLIIFIIYNTGFPQNQYLNSNLIPIIHFGGKDAAKDLLFSVSNGTYTPLVSPVQVITPGIDEQLTAAINIGFNFIYDGITYSQFAVSSNGWMVLGSPGTLNPGATNDLSSTTYKPILAPLWDDLATNSQTGKVSYLLSGSAPNRIITIEFKDMNWTFDFPFNLANFQIKLFETSNQIQFCYGPIDGSPGVNAGASIGINDAIGGSGHFISVTPGNIPTVSSNIANNDISDATGLSSGTIYTFAPVGSSTVFNGNINPTTVWQNASYNSGTIPYWSFNAVAGRTYNLSLCADAEDSYLRIYDSTNTLLQSDNDNGPYCSGVSASLDFNPPLTGKYYIVASANPYSVLLNSSTVAYRYTVNNMSFSSCTSTQSNTSEALMNTTNNQVLDLKIVTAGTNSALHATSFTLNTTGTTNLSDIANAKLWTTGTSPVFATTTQFGATMASPNGIMTFSGNSTLSPGTNYFWLTYDIVNNAIAPNVVDAQFTSVTVGGTAFTPTVTNPAGFRQVWNINYGGGPAYGSYFFANSVPGTGAPSEPPYTWIDPVASGHTLLTTWSSGGSGDDDYFQIPDIGFNFYFFGTVYRTNNVFISSNGFVTFGDGSIDFISYALPDISAPYNMIAAAECDLDCSTSVYPDSKVYFGGNANQFVITWIHAHALEDASTYITFQIILYANGSPANNSTYVFQYNDDQTSTLATNSIVQTCSVGLNNGDGTVGMNYRFNRTRGPIFKGIAYGPNGVNALSIGFGPNTNALPVELSAFNSSVSGRDVKLSWTTTTEINNDLFKIERQILISNNQFSAWQEIGFVKGKVNKISPTVYNFIDNKLIAGRYNYRIKQVDNNGNYRYYTLNTFVDIGLPGKFNLSQNYPNPFNPTTKIDYDLPSDSKVTILIYDILGKEVNKLVNGDQKAGYYSVQFNAINLASGIYFYRLIANSKNNNIIITKKMSVIK